MVSSRISLLKSSEITCVPRAYQRQSQAEAGVRTPGKMRVNSSSFGPMQVQHFGMNATTIGCLIAAVCGMAGYCQTIHAICECSHKHLS